MVQQFGTSLCVLDARHVYPVMYGNSIDVVFTLDFGEGRQSPPTRFQKAIDWASWVDGRSEHAVTQGVEQRGQGAGPVSRMFLLCGYQGARADVQLVALQ
jgi:hypothetical protein